MVVSISLPKAVFTLNTGLKPSSTKSETSRVSSLKSLFKLVTRARLSFTIWSIVSNLPLPGSTNVEPLTIHLPIEGRAATIIRSEGCKPLVFLSKSVKPVDTPVTSLSWPASSSMREIVLRKAPETLIGPSFAVVRFSAISNTLVSARSSNSLLSRPSGLKLMSAMSLAAPISSRTTARSLTMFA